MNECTGGVLRTGVWGRTAVAVTLVGLAGCGSVGTPAQLDARFVASVRADGHDVPGGPEKESVLVAAARKICDRRGSHPTPERRREVALTQHELDAVTQTFTGDPRRFATLALDTYCPS